MVTWATLRDAPAARRAGGVIERFGGAPVLLLLIWPWAITAANPNWIYLNATSSIDSWIYFGHFLNLREYVHIYTDQSFYYITRLGWILPGFAAYQLLPPLAANLALRLFVFYIAVFSVYGALAGLQRRAALLAALLLGGYSYFLLSAGWDYVDGVGTAYLALAAYLLVAAQRRRSRLFLGLAGAVLAMLVSTNLFTATFVPAYGVAYLAMARRRPLDVLLDAASAAAGLVAMLGALGLANAALGGDLFFLGRSLYFARAAYGMAANPWVAAVPDWPLRFGFLVWPQLGLAGAALALAIPQARSRLAALPLGQALVLLYLMVALTMLAWQLRPSSPVLLTVFYSSYLIAPLFVCLGVLAAPSLASLGRRQFGALVAGAALASVAGPILGSCRTTGSPQVVLALAAGALAIALLLRPGGHIVAASGLVLALTIATPSAFSRFQGFDTCRVIAGAQQRPSDVYLAVIDARNAIHEMAPGRRVYFWYGQPDQPAYIGLSSAYIWTWNQIGVAFPAINKITGEPTIVLLSDRADALQSASAALRASGRTSALLGQRRIERGGVQFDLSVLETRLLPATLAPGQPLDLSRDGPRAEVALRSGWSRPEGFGAWTNGPQAELQLSVDGTGGTSAALVAEVKASGLSFSADRSPLTATVLVNGVKVGEWRFDESSPAGERRVTVPAAVLEAADVDSIVLLIDSPRHPVDAKDTRLLGIAVARLRVEPAGAAP